MRHFLCILVLVFGISSMGFSQSKSQNEFWQKISAHCGKSYEGKITSPGKNEGFDGEKLIMHVKSCSDKILKIPFMVGENRSRTWVLTNEADGIVLKHDHRLESGLEDSVTQYGGKATNGGNPNKQFFPADQQTCDLLDYACFNVWWITIDENTFTYNLRRVGTDRLFTVEFDLTKPVP
ncbi:MAG: hypothetical protein ABIN48_04865, partial [Ginsengibacter sp.]